MEQKCVCGHYRSIHYAGFGKCYGYLCACKEFTLDPEHLQDGDWRDYRRTPEDPIIVIAQTVPAGVAVAAQMRLKNFRVVDNEPSSMPLLQGLRVRAIVVTPGVINEMTNDPLRGVIFDAASQAYWSSKNALEG